MGSNRHDLSPKTIKVLSRFINGFITHCPSTQAEIAASFAVPDRVCTIPHGNYIGTYENTISPAQARAELGIPAADLTFLLFGSIYYYKGYLEAIDAFQQIHPDRVRLIVAGNPQEAGLHEKLLARAQENDAIQLILKRIPDDEIQLYMNAADCVIVPYKVFTTSGIAILAMSFGRACIAPNVGFFSDMLDESGSFLYDADHSDGIRHAMKVAIEQRNQIAAMGDHNLALAKQWNWNFVAKETVNVYRKCLDH
nr:glycosyltransferase family 4 protein [Oculatella sp. LEGE 06141]